MSDSNSKDWWAPIRNGLVTDPHGKHIKAMGPALPLYLYLHIFADREKGRLFRKYQTISEHMGIPNSTIKKWMKRLKSRGYVELTSLGNGLSIQITKFRPIRSTKSGREKYQIEEGEVPDSTRGIKVGTSSSDSKQKTNDVSSPNNGTSKESIKESNKESQLFSPSADEALAIKMYQMLLKINPKHKKPNFPKWEKDIELMQTQDGRTLAEISGLFAYANSHPFWKSNILCPEKLRKNFDRLSIEKSSIGNGGGYRSQADHNSSSTGRAVV